MSVQAKPCLLLMLSVLACTPGAHSQTAPEARQATQPAVPDAPPPQGLRQRPVQDGFSTDKDYYAPPVMINGRPYVPPTQHDLFADYLRDSYGGPAMARSLVRTLYNQGLDQPAAWGQDGTSFWQRFGSNVGITAINGNVRYAMEEVFHEDLRYIPCHGCNFKHKIENALLAEITARHDSDGHRFFTLTPTVADFSGAIVARATWYPAGVHSALIGGIIATRTVFATRIGGHLFQEFVLERRHHDVPEQPRTPAITTSPEASAAVPGP